MPRYNKSKSSNEHQASKAKKSKDKPTYKIIVLGSGGVGKVSLIYKVSQKLCNKNNLLNQQ
jgi:GTPase SAR1 family protein